MVHLTRVDFFRAEISATFHGRDIFAPVAAHLAAGAEPEAMGEVIQDPVKLEPPAPKGFPGRLDPLAVPERLTAPQPAYVSLQSALYHHG